MSKRTKVISLVVLWGLAIFFTTRIYHSINDPIRFNKIKNDRYAVVIDRLKDIRIAQIAHKDVKGQFANNFDSLVSFVDEGIFTITQQRDSSYYAYNPIYQIDMLQEIVIIDTLGFISVRDSLFGNDLRYKDIAKIPIKGVDEEFELEAKIIDKNGFKVPVFEVKVPKKIILHDQNKRFLAQEEELVSVDGVNGPEIILGSLSDVSTNGNWPTIFDAERE
ncbi:MAG: hypothetical protein OXC92_07770 [Flavobacteriaceae bacterium]|nr:hypothetical protein [Flavobacteriaceae bacterium]MCY4216860.1 hypothetical protein [Flavobacteriaceae bacterium]MCY4253420.1 hypothetical protein [Flavobacteriaceae bacterium]